MPAASHETLLGELLWNTQTTKGYFVFSIHSMPCAASSRRGEFFALDSLQGPIPGKSLDATVAQQQRNFSVIHLELGLVHTKFSHGNRPFSSCELQGVAWLELFGGGNFIQFSRVCEEPAVVQCKRSGGHTDILSFLHRLLCYLSLYDAPNMIVKSRSFYDFFQFSIIL